MIWKISLLLFFVALSTALPETQSNVTCEDGSVALKELLRRHRDWFPEENPSSTETGLDFNYVFEGIMGYQIEDFPDNFLCDFESVNSVEELYYQLERTRYVHKAFKLLYNVFAIFGYYALEHSSAAIQNPQPWDNITESHITLDASTHMAEAGLFSMNHEGFMWISRLATIVLRDEVDPEVFYDEDELSTDTLDTQVLRISNDLRKIWNIYHWHWSQYDSQASATMRATLEKWTGITLTTHDSIKLIVAEILVSTQMDDPMTWLYNMISGRDILKSATTAAYPDAAMGIMWLEMSFSGMPDTQRPEYVDLILVTIESMTNLGLLSLQ